jgi:hypothetical protein
VGGGQRERHGLYSSLLLLLPFMAVLFFGVSVNSVIKAKPKNKKKYLNNNKNKLSYVGDIKVIKALIDLEFTSLALVALAAFTLARLTPLAQTRTTSVVC